jgi:hypothetical protein
MTKMHVFAAGLALSASLMSPAAADDDKVAEAIDAAVSDLNLADDGYVDYFTGDEIDVNERSEWLPTLVTYADRCSASVKKALQVAPPSTEMALWHRTITLGEGEVVCDRLRVAVKNQLEEELGPWKKALKGDRLTLWMKYQQGFYGPGCKSISKPAQLAKAKSWYIILEDDSGVVYRWTTRQYSFKGDKLVVNGKERTGTGRNPPSKACP